MTQAILKVCTANVRKPLIEPCGETLRKTEGTMVCPNRAMHLLPFVTGFCNSGWHEGHKIPKPTCRFWQTCPCDCHTMLSRMASMALIERVVVDNSTYVPDRGGFVRVSLTESLAERITTQPNVRVVASQAPGIVPDTIERQFNQTSSGRAARGQLEEWVLAVTSLWATEMPENCTPQYVSREINRMYGLGKSPSTGAIDAVFRRWEKIGFAIIGNKPARFIRYTPAGIKDGLEVLKAKAKRS